MYDDVNLIFDLDGTICPIKKEGQEYDELSPDAEMVEKMRWYKQEGARIIILTARNMNRYDGDLEKINRYTSVEVKEWLRKWEVPYDEIFFGKPWAGKRGLYIDDRTVRPDEFLRRDFEDLEEECKRSAVGEK